MRWPHRPASVLYLEAALVCFVLLLPYACFAARPEEEHDGSNVGVPLGGGGPKSEEEKISHSVAQGEAIMLLASIPLLGLKGYLLTHHQEKVRKHATKNVSSIIVIFIAVTIERGHNSSLSYLQKLTFQVERTWLIPFYSFAFWWAATAVLCFLLRKRTYDLVAARDIGSHVSAFCAMDALGNILLRFSSDEDFGNKRMALLYKTLTFISMCLIFAALVHISAVALKTMPFNRRTDEDVGRRHSQPRRSIALVNANEKYDRAVDIDVFVHEVEEGYEEAALLALSYLFSKFFVQQGIIDMLNLSYAQDSFDGREHFWILQNPDVLFACGAMLIIVLGIDLLLLVAEKLQITSNGSISQTFGSMMMAWTWMRLIRFIIIHWSSDITSIYIITAFIATPLGSLQIFVGDFLVKYGWLSGQSDETRSEAFGFMVGFAWEHAYVAAISTILNDFFAGNIKTTPEAAKLQAHKSFAVNAMISSILTAVMLAGWRYLLLPHAYAFLHHGHHNDGHEAHQKSPGHEKKDWSDGGSQGTESSDDRHDETLHQE